MRLFVKLIGLICGLLLLCNYLNAESLLPSDVPRCKAGDVECIKSSVTVFLKKYPTGYAPLAFPSVEPFKVDRLKIDDTSSRQVNLKIDLKNIIVEGLGSTVIKRIVGFEKDPRTSKFEVYAVVPHIKMASSFKADGRIMVIPVKGRGKFVLTLENVSAGIKFKPKITTKGGKSFLSVDKIKAIVEPEKLHVKLEPEPGSGAFSSLGTNLNDFLNENWKQVWQELYPSISETFLEVAKSLIDKPLSRVAYEDVLD